MCSLRNSEHVDRASNIRLDGLDRVVLVVHWRRRASQVIEEVTLKKDRLSHIMTKELKVRIILEVTNVALGSCEEVINRYYLMPLREQNITEVGTNEPRSSRNHNSCHNPSFRP